MLRTFDDSADHCDVSLVCSDGIILPNDNAIENSDNIAAHKDDKIGTCESSLLKAESGDCRCLQ